MNAVIPGDLNQPNQVVRLQNEKKKGFNLIITRSYSIDLMLGHEELMKTGLMHKTRGFHPLEITVEI